MNAHALPYPWSTPGFPSPGQLFRLGRLLAREPEYKRLWRQHHDTSLLEAAGFFDDQLTRPQAQAVESFRRIAAPLAWWSPLPPMSAWTRAAQSGRPVVVLLATGAFAPFHEGHRAMLLAAQNATQDRGMEVLATYVSPSHDSYVSGKDSGAGARFPATERVDALRRAVADMNETSSVPLLVDPWESLVAPKALNFTTVIRRLAHYLNAYRPKACPPVQVVYVFGADNAAFSLAFEPNEPARPATICVGRAGLPSSPTGLFVPLDLPQSSTRIRRTKEVSLATPRSTPSGTFLIRNEGLWALSHWAQTVPSSALEMAWSRFARGVRLVLEQAFGAGSSGPRPAHFEWVEVEAQRAQVREWAGLRSVVALDPCVSDLPGVVAWPFSRYFPVSDHQARPESRGLRPGHLCPRLPESWHSAWLVDDDVATGKSMAAATRAVESMGVMVEAQKQLAPDVDVFDVVDLRDFLPGAKEAGLVVQTPSGQRVRVPYMAPFTDLTTRALLPPGKAWQASAKLWRVAGQFFHSLPVELRVSDMWPSAAQALTLQGFEESLALARWCDDMAQVLEASPPSCVSVDFSPDLGHTNPFMGQGDEHAVV